MKINPYHPHAQGLIRCYVHNEGGGSTIYDLTGLGTAGTITGGAVWTPEGIDFDGVDGNAHGNFPHDDLVLSIVQGVKLDSLGESDIGRTVIVKTDVVDGYGVVHDSASYSLTGSFADEYPNENTSVSVASVLTQYKEHNIAVTHSNAAAPKLYVDGEEVVYASQTFYGTLTSNPTEFTIGANTSAGVYAFDGVIKYTYIYDHVLSDAMVLSLDRDPYGMFVPDFTPSIITVAGDAGVANAGAMMMAMMI